MKTACSAVDVRQRIVGRALASLRALGIHPGPDVLALHERYVSGAISRKQLHAIMQQRAATIENNLNS